MSGLLYLLPLCLVVSLVYEATHEEEMSRIWRKGLKLFVMLAGSLVALAGVMLALGRVL
jgi:hypothetical protein